MLFILPILPHQLFPPLNLFHWDQDCLKSFTSKTEIKNARHTQSHWLVALLSWDNWAFTPLLARVYFCCIARSDDINIFSVISWGREQLASWYANCLLQEAMMTTIIFFHVVSQASKWAYIFMSYCKGASDGITSYTLYLKGASVHSIAREQAKTKVNHCKQARDSYEGMAWPTTQQSNIICCQAHEATTMSISLMLYRKRSNNVI